MSKRNTLVSAAITAARSVEKSHSKHHAALMALMAEAARSETPLTLLSEYTRNRHIEAPDTLCTRATFAWLNKHFGLRVDDGGECKNGREFTRKGFTATTFEAARAEPWDKLAKEMAFKVPQAIAWSSAASTAAKLEVDGKDMPTMEEVYQEFVSAVAAYKKSEGFAQWTAEYRRQKAANE